MKTTSRTYQNLKTQNGFSLVEILVVIVAIGFLVLLLGNIPSSISLIGQAKTESLAREIASKQIEDERTIQYNNLADGTQNINDSRLSLLPSGTGTILVEDCSSQVCTQNENIKQITVTVNWKEAGVARTVILKTLIGQGGISL